jgi:hypothetical protein
MPLALQVSSIYLAPYDDGISKSTLINIRGIEMNVLMLILNIQHLSLCMTSFTKGSFFTIGCLLSSASPMT